MANERNRISRLENKEPTTRDKILGLIDFLSEERQEKIYKYMLGLVGEQVTNN